MISGLVPFEEIIEAVKDETGIENLRPFYEKIRRLLFRAEREIGYGGSVVLKKVIYKNPDHYAGKYFTYPVDFIELEGIGSCCHRICESKYQKTSDGIRFKTTQTKDVVLLYWGIFCDGYGNPVTTRNHQEAAIAYIVWKLYTPKVFLGIGNMNAKMDYKQEFISALMEARGDDAFPTLEEWNEIGLLSYSDRRALIMHPTAAYNYCADEMKTECEIITDENAMKVYYFQLDGVNLGIESFAAIDEDDATLVSVDPAFLSTKPFASFQVFQSGKIIDWSLIGKTVFAIQETENLDFQLTDALNNDITDEYNNYYDEVNKTAYFVSKVHRSYSSIYYKFKKIITNA